MVGYIIEPVGEERIDEVIRVNEVCLPEHYGRFFYEDLYRRFPKMFLIAREGEKVVGYIMCRIEFGFSELGLKIKRKSHVVSIAVLPEHQRKGVGSLLVKGAIKAATDYGASECFLEVRKSNESAVNFYRNLGFKVTSTKKSYYLDGEDAYVMAKAL